MKLDLDYLIDNLPGPSFVMLSDFKSKYSNKSWLQLIGYPAFKLQEIELQDMIDSHCWNSIKSWKRSKEALFKKECILTKANGSKVLIDLQLQKSDDLIIGMAYPIREQSVGELSLSQKLSLFDKLNDDMNDLITLQFENDEIKYVNKSIFEIFGYHPKQIIGTNLQNRIHPEDLDRIYKKRAYAIENQIENYVQVLRFQHKDGHYVWIEAKINHEYGLNKQPVRSFAIARDITKRIEYENALIEAKQMAENAAKSKSEYLSEISHDIRTPLNTIIGVSHLLQNKSPRKDQLDLINTIKFSGDNLISLINDILDFSKIQANKLDFEKVDFNLSLLLKSLKIGFKTPADSKGLKFNVITKGKVPEIVKGDSVRLNQILNNLLSNSIKFTNQGSVKLAVSSEESKDQYQITFIVSDTGIGIPNDKKEQIFEPYVQAEKDTTRKYGGTGLGLAILKKLVELQGGTIDLESQLNKGSTFTVKLNFEKPDASESKGFIESGELKKIKALYVEDVVSNQFLMKGFFSMWGLDLEVSGTGERALKLMEKEKFDLLMIDLQLPDISGFELIQRIRSMDDAYYRNLPILAVTGDVTEKTRLKLNSMQVNDVVAKPINPDTLYHKISEHIDDEFVEEIAKNGPSNSFEANFNTLDSLYTAKPKDYVSLLSLIKIEYNKYQEALQYSIDHKDLKSVRKISHKMKPNLKTLGMHQFIDYLEEVKKNLREEKVTADTYRINSKISRLFDNFHQLIDDKINQLDHEE